MPFFVKMNGYLGLRKTSGRGFSVFYKTPSVRALLLHTHSCQQHASPPKMFFAPGQDVQRPTHQRLHVRDAKDAQTVFEAVRRGTLKPVTRRLNEIERSMFIQSGAIFVWEQSDDELGLKRWTDGRVWSQSRMREVSRIKSPTAMSHSPSCYTFPSLPLSSHTCFTTRNCRMTQAPTRDTHLGESRRNCGKITAHLAPTVRKPCFAL